MNLKFSKTKNSIYIGALLLSGFAIAQDSIPNAEADQAQAMEAAAEAVTVKKDSSNNFKRIKLDGIAAVVGDYVILDSDIEKTLIEKLKISPKFSMGGGTSDGRFLKKLECEVIEFGPTNQSIHKANENISLSKLSKLEKTYLHTLIGLHNHAAKI